MVLGQRAVAGLNDDAFVAASARTAFEPPKDGRPHTTTAPFGAHCHRTQLAHARGAAVQPAGTDHGMRRIERDQVIGQQRVARGQRRELVAGAEMVLTKPGYGIFAEAALGRTRLLWVRRGAFPEAPFLADSMRQLFEGFQEDVSPMMEDLAEQLKGLSQYHPPEVLPNGDIIIRRKPPEELTPDAPLDEDGAIDI